MVSCGRLNWLLACLQVPVNIIVSYQHTHGLN